MTMVLEARALVVTPEIPQEDEHAEAADARDEIIASHRLALLELAPHQAWRSVREETGWHMEHLGLLLCVRDAQTQNTAPGGVPGRERREESTGTDRLTH